MIKLSEEELDKYRDLVKDAQTTPVILIGDVDMSAQAWNRVQYFMRDMATKYKYDYMSHVINMKTGDIITIEEAKELERKKNES